jgi:hypothetical protein
VPDIASLRAAIGERLGGRRFRPLRRQVGRDPGLSQSSGRRPSVHFRVHRRGEAGDAARRARSRGPAGLSLDGPIQPDGPANLEARDLTGDPYYNINQTTQAVPYEHDLSARFGASRGAGNWRALQSNGQTRTCDFTFTRQ